MAQASPPIDRTAVRKLTSGLLLARRLHAVASTNALPVREVRRSWDPSYVAPKLCQIVQQFHRRVDGRFDEGSRRQHPKFANAQVDASLEHFAAIPTGPGSDFHVIRSNRD